MAPRPLTVQVGLGAILGGACADAFVGAGAPEPVIGATGEIDAPWSDHTAAAFDTAESVLRGGMAPFDLAPEAAHTVAIAGHRRAAVPLLSDPEAVAMHEFVACLLERPRVKPDLQAYEGPAGAAIAAATAAVTYEQAVRSVGTDPQLAVLTGIATGAFLGAQSIPSRWLTYVRGEGGGRIRRLRDLLRLNERLLGIEIKFPPDPHRSIGPLEVVDGIHAANLYSIGRFARANPEGAIVSLCPVGARLDDHRVRREYLLEDLPSTTANPHLCGVLDDVLVTIDAFRAEGRPVLVHCHHGKSRTGLVLRAWLMRSQGLTEWEATAECEARWPWTSTANRGFTKELRRRESDVGRP